MAVGGKGRWVGSAGWLVGANLVAWGDASEVRQPETAPVGLLDVGTPWMLLYAPPRHVMLFGFKSGRSGALENGDGWPGR